MQSDPAGLHPILRTIALVAAVVFLSGCEGPYVAGQNPQPQLVVDRVQDAYNVPLGRAGAPLPPSALQALARFLAGTGLRHGDRVGLAVPQDTQAQRDAVLSHLLLPARRPPLRHALTAVP